MKYATGFNDGKILKANSESTEAIIKIVNKLQCLCQKKVKNLHTDGDKEEKTKPLKAFLDSHIIKSSTTVPHYSQQNAFAERRFESIMQARWTAFFESKMPSTFFSYGALNAMDKNQLYPSQKRRQTPTISAHTDETQWQPH